jgi:hypothetical protein
MVPMADSTSIIASEVDRRCGKYLNGLYILACAYGVGHLHM